MGKGISKDNVNDDEQAPVSVAMSETFSINKLEDSVVAVRGAYILEKVVQVKVDNHDWEDARKLFELIQHVADISILVEVLDLVEDDDQEVVAEANGTVEHSDVMKRTSTEHFGGL